MNFFGRLVVKKTYGSDRVGAQSPQTHPLGLLPLHVPLFFCGHEGGDTSKI